MRIRRLRSDDERGRIAQRMRSTLVEALGAPRAEAMYTMAWLERRVSAHLGRDDAAVWLATTGDGILGHTIVRIEATAGAPIGLFDTTYVTPDARRQGAARALLSAGEAWMRARKLTRAATWAAHNNHKLIELYDQRGYTTAAHAEEMVRLEPAL